MKYVILLLVIGVLVLGSVSAEIEEGFTVIDGLSANMVWQDSLTDFEKFVINLKNLFSPQMVLDGIDYTCEDNPYRQGESLSGRTERIISTSREVPEGAIWIRTELRDVTNNLGKGSIFNKAYGDAVTFDNLNPSVTYKWFQFACYPTNQPPTNQCTDTDGGIKPNIRGKVTDLNGDVYEDYCDTDTHLKEYYCSEGKYANRKGIDCACEEDTQGIGACITLDKCSSPNGDAGQFYCSNGNIKKCTSDGWKPHDVCDSQYETGNCKTTDVSDSQALCELKERTDCENPNGNAGQFYCVNGRIYECEDNDWKSKEDCPSLTDCKTNDVSDSKDLCVEPPPPQDLVCCAKYNLFSKVEMVKASECVGLHQIITKDDDNYEKYCKDLPFKEKQIALTEEKIKKATPEQLVNSLCNLNSECDNNNCVSQTFLENKGILTKAGFSEAIKKIEKEGLLVTLTKLGIGTTGINFISGIFGGEKEKLGLCFDEKKDGFDIGNLGCSTADALGLKGEDKCTFGWVIIGLVIFMFIAILTKR